MTRKRYIWNPETREFDEIGQRAVPERGQVITDTMPLTWHPMDGQHYDSKSEFRRVTKAHGGLETGGESQAHVEKNRFVNTMDSEQRKRDIAHAIQEVRARSGRRR